MRRTDPRSGPLTLDPSPFVHLNDAAEFARFDRPDHVKVAWAVRCVPRGERETRIEFEVRVDATDEAAWRKFRHYFRFIGPASRFIRHTLLADLADEFGSPERTEHRRPLPGDELLHDASAQVTHGITITAPPERIWPWLVQVGCGRAGFYAIDALDNGGEASTREIHPEWQRLHVGQVLPATPKGDEGLRDFVGARIQSSEFPRQSTRRTSRPSGTPERILGEPAYAPVATPCKSAEEGRPMCERQA